MYDHRVSRRLKQSVVGRLLLGSTFLLVLTLSGSDAAEVFECYEEAHATWIRIPYGPRGVGMGSAYSALADGLTGVYWTPAGLAFSDGVNATETGYIMPANELDANSRLSFVGCSVSASTVIEGLPLGTLAIWRRDYTYKNVWLGSAEKIDAAVTGFSYGHLLWGSLGIGITYKRVTSDLYDEHGNGWDAGVLLKREIPIRKSSYAIRIGAASGVRNLGQVQWSLYGMRERSRLPRRAYLGAAITACSHRPVPLGFTLSAEGSYADYLDGNPRQRRGSIGLEAAFFNGISGRYGWREGNKCDDEEKSVGAGLALRYGNLAGISIDWSHSDMGHLNDVDRWMLSLTLWQCTNGLNIEPRYR
jgi:hypothetical protein